MEAILAIEAGIIEKAESDARRLIADAESEREELKAQVRETEERRKAAALESARSQADAVISRRKTLCELESRKAELAAKQKVIDEAYEEAVRKILNMTDHIYREFIENLVCEYAEDGDRVIISERDVKRLSADWLSAISARTGKHLTLESETHKGLGGVILSGKSCDKNLTLEAMVKSLRATTLSACAKKLFK